jgi:hypothetical protein
MCHVTLQRYRRHNPTVIYSTELYYAVLYTILTPVVPDRTGSIMKVQLILMCTLRFVSTRARPLPEIDGKVELLNKTPPIDGCVRCGGCGGIKVSII